MVLAAGAGRRMGRPKALIRDGAGMPWVVLAARLLTDAGCSPVVVVVGAAADQVRAVLADVEVVEAVNWAEGMGASLRAGLRAVDAEAVVVMPVDAPGVTADVVRRVVGAVDPELVEEALVRAAYDGSPGHPVVLGRAHWHGVTAAAVGDEGARPYLQVNRPVLVECADLADGRDIDSEEELPQGHH